MESTIATNLNRIRKWKNLTMQELADMAEISKQAISHYENGIRHPESPILIKLAKALNVDLSDFYEDKEVDIQLNSVYYRQGSHLSDLENQAIKDFASAYIKDYLELEEISDEEVQFDNPLKDQVIANPADALKAAKEIRKKWRLGDAPIYNIANLLERKGIRVFKVIFNVNIEGLSGWVTQSSIPVIMINARQLDVPRMRFTLLHEVGHLLLAIREGITEEMIERICDTFAGAVLLPEEIISQTFSRGRTRVSMAELRNLKELYGISIMAIMVRARSSDAISIDQFCRWKESDYFGVDSGMYPGEEEPKRFFQMLYKCLSENKIGFDKAAKLSKKSEFHFRKEYYENLEYVF